MPDITFTNVEMAEAARREAGQRRRVYARLIGNGKMTQTFANRQIAIMDAIAEKLEALAKGDRLL